MRIRSIKPSFFRHEGLQDLEAANPGAYPMLTFAGLWGHCDKAGRFEWKPRILKLDILPFLSFDMVATLGLLIQAGFVRRYAVGDREFGVIDSFAEHQRVGGKEAENPERFPAPPSGINGEALGCESGMQEGKGIKEGNGDTSESSGCPTCPQQKIVELYRELLPELPNVRHWHDSRQALLRSRWVERWKAKDFRTQEEGVEWFRRYFDHVSRSDFLTGRSARNGKHSDWACDIEFLLNKSKMARVIEGNYDNKDR